MVIQTKYMTSVLAKNQVLMKYAQLVLIMFTSGIMKHKHENKGISMNSLLVRRMSVAGMTKMSASQEGPMEKSSSGKTKQPPQSSPLKKELSLH